MSVVNKITNVEKHKVPCPHCGKDVLDHMTKCPFCEGALTPAGYKPMDEETRKRVKRILSIIGFAAAAVVILLILINR